MKQKSIFSKIMIIIAIALICLVATISVALLLGSNNTNIFDFSNLNMSNVIAVILIGGFISCVVVGILVIFLAKDILVKGKDYFSKNRE